MGPGNSSSTLPTPRRLRRSSANHNEAGPQRGASTDGASTDDTTGSARTSHPLQARLHVIQLRWIS